MSKMRLEFNSITDILDLADKLKPINDSRLKETKKWFSDKDVSTEIVGNVLTIDLSQMSESLKQEMVAYLKITNDANSKFDEIYLSKYKIEKND